MDATKMTKLLELVSDLVDEDGPYQKKRDALLVAAGPQQRMDLEEFVSWFEVD